MGVLSPLFNIPMNMLKGYYLLIWGETRFMQLFQFSNLDLNCLLIAKGYLDELLNSF